jgi:hypothetical protein
MNILSQKIPMKFTHLPGLLSLMSGHGSDFTNEVIKELLKTKDKIPASSNATYAHVASGLFEVASEDIYFRFYTSKNPFIGHRVISHATDKNTVNYNTRFHSVKNFQLVDWVGNLFHEMTHLADQQSPLTFGHNGQNDTMSAPEVVGRIAKEVYRSKRWL